MGTSGFRVGQVDYAVGSQQEWHTLISDTSEVDWSSRKLPEGPVMLSFPLNCLILHLNSTSQYVFSPSPDRV